MAASSVYDHSSMWDMEEEPHSSSFDRSQSYSGSARLLPTATEVEAQVIFSGSSLDPSRGSYDSGYQSNHSYPVTYNTSLSEPLGQAFLALGKSPQDTQFVAPNPNPWYPGSRASGALSTYSDQANSAQFWSELSDPSSLNQGLQPFATTQHFLHGAGHSILGHNRSPPRASPSNLSNVEGSQDKSYYRTECIRCGQVFTGKYSRGNCARHIHQKHEGVSSDNAQHTCRVCKREFNRKDAKRKHEWRQHRLPDARPHKRGPRSTQMVSRQSSVKNDGGCSSVYGKSPLTPQHNVSIETSDIFQVPMHSKHAHAVFGSIKARLDQLGGNDYAIFCKLALSSWKDIVANMRSKGLETSEIFSQVLHDLTIHLSARTQTQLNVADVPRLSIPTESNFKTAAGTPAQSNYGKAPLKGQVRTSTSQKGTKGNARPQDLSERARGKTAVKHTEPIVKPKKQMVDCQIHKYHIMHGMESPCKGCRKENMSTLRLHIKRGKVHAEFVPFLERCKRCATNVVSEQAMVDGGHKAGTCTQRDEPHGSLILNWVRLYRDIFPEETQVPHPDPDEHGWLSPAFVEAIMSGRVAEPSQPTQPSPNGHSPTSFLDEQLPNMGTAITAQHLLSDIIPPMSLGYIAALDTILASALHLTARLLADKHVHNLRDDRPTDEIIAEYSMRLDYVQNVASGSNNFPGQLAIEPSNLGVPQQLPSDSGTGPSSRGHRISLTSSLDTSNTSLSSLDAPFSNFQTGTTMQPPEWFLNTNEPDAGAVDGSSFPDWQYQMSCASHGNPVEPWMPGFDEILDAPGSSRTPQILAELQEDMKMRLLASEFTHMDSPAHDSEDEG